jgi:hypothetical protein
VLRLAFDDPFEGDRVWAFAGGLGSMIMASYDNKESFFILDSLDPQKLYNSARNVEVAAWKLRHDRSATREPFLISYQAQGEEKNFSFERLFGKLIAIQDVMSQIVAQKTRRIIKHAVQFFIFLPI